MVSVELDFIFSHVQENVTAVLTASTTDVLSHVAIRARSQKVKWTCCTCSKIGTLHFLSPLFSCLSYSAYLHYRTHTEVCAGPTCNLL